MKHINTQNKAKADPASTQNKMSQCHVKKNKQNKMQSLTHASESQKDRHFYCRPWSATTPCAACRVAVETQGKGGEGGITVQLRGPSCLPLWASSPGTRTRPCWWSSSSRRPRRSRSSSACSSAHRWGPRSRSGPACCWRRGGGLLEATVCAGPCLAVNTVKEDRRTLGAKLGQQG